MVEEKKEFRGIVRVCDKDLNGNLTITRALTKIRGLGLNFSRNIADIAAKEVGLVPNEKVGNLTEEQVDKLEDIILNPEKHGIPTWFLNRRNQRATGKTIHLVGSDLDFQQKQDIEFEKNMRSYRGIRHMFGLPVRGQRTKTMGRGQTTLGVIRKKEMPGKAPGKAGAAEPKKEDKKKK